MKIYYLIGTIILLFSVTTLKAQKKAELDNNVHITVTRTEKMTGKNREIHYTLTNNNAVSMDFSLYKQLTNGSWDVTHHLDLPPGQTYEDVSGFTGVNGKYVLFSAPHKDWASFPNAFDIDKQIAGNPSAVITAPTTTSTPATTTPGSSTPSTPAAKSSPSPGSNPSNNNSAPPVPPPM